MLGSNRYVEANNGTYTYTYYDAETTASPQVKSLVYTYSSQTYSRDYENFYEYDNKGNITGVYQLDGTEKVYSHKYYYDEANQLVREDFPGGDRTVVYAYDVGGNLRSRTWYQPTFGSLDNMEPTQVINYGYGDGNWADRLTSYNGTSVDADEMGNITLFENTQLTWTAGRQLETTTYHGVTKRYYYNADGYIAKIVSTDASTGEEKEEIDYFWQDGKILALRQKDLRNDGDETIYEYLYDSDGELQAIESGAPDPDNHVNTAEVAETDSTETEHGYTAGVYCSDCKQYISGHEEKPLLVPDEPVTVPDEPVTVPDEPVTVPDEPATEPNTEPTAPATEPATEPTTVPAAPTGAIHGARCFCYNYTGNGLFASIVRFICAVYNFF